MWLSAFGLSFRFGGAFENVWCWADLWLGRLQDRVAGPGGPGRPGQAFLGLQGQGALLEACLDGATFFGEGRDPFRGLVRKRSRLKR